MSDLRRFFIGILVILFVMEYGFSAETSQSKVQALPRRTRLDNMYVHTCMTHLKQLEGATQEWALENKPISPAGNG